jgi:membrane-bound ClpP family serine protease
MNNLKSLNKHYETIAWGLGFIWIGILGIIPGNQTGIALLSIGLILLILNLTRYLKKMPVNGFSSVLGILCSALGAVVLVRQMLGYPGLELDLFAILLIVTGLYILIPSPKHMKEA